MNTQSTTPRCGMIAIVGKPNVGKSTLLNALVGQKISITSRKAQTTRHRIHGICSREASNAQFIFVDTPGFQTRHSNALNKTLNKTVLGALADVDLIFWVVEAGRLSGADEQVLSRLPTDVPVLVLANKLDTVKDKSQLFDWLKALDAKREFIGIVPMSAKRKDDIERLLETAAPLLPEQTWWHEADTLTDRNERFLAAEVVREKLFRLTGDELPYTSTVVIDQFEEEVKKGSKTGERGLCRISATIIVERDSHKAMIIGQQGLHLKRLGSEARQDLEKLLDCKVFLQVWVKVKSGWADNEAHIKSYGYGD